MHAVRNFQIMLLYTVVLPRTSAIYMYIKFQFSYVLRLPKELLKYITGTNEYSQK